MAQSRDACHLSSFNFSVTHSRSCDVNSIQLIHYFVIIIHLFENPEERRKNLQISRLIPLIKTQSKH